MVAPPIDFLNSFFWQFTTIIVGIVAIIGFLVYRYYLEPPIARWFTSAKWSSGQPAFIENEVGEVVFKWSDKDYPNGLKHIKKFGWFANSLVHLARRELEEKKGRGRPPKEKPIDSQNLERDKVFQNASGTFYVDKEGQVLELLTHTPVLKGFGKHVFFGSATSIALTNLKAIAHADLRAVNSLAPDMWDKTLLSSIADNARREAQKEAGGEKTKLLFYIILAIIPIAVTGLIVFLLLNGGG